jgi:hypothetical protein
VVADHGALATTRRAVMFTADGRPSDDDPRENGPTLVDSLRRQRLTLELTCAGLDAEAMARRSIEPSTMSLVPSGSSRCRIASAMPVSSVTCSG